MSKHAVAVARVARRARRALPALLLLLLTAWLALACSGDRRPARDAAEEEPPAGEELAPAEGALDRPPPSRPAETFAFAVDQSASMAGFAEAEMIEPITLAASRAFQDVGGNRDTVPFYSIGARVEKVDERALWSRGRFRQPRADLLAALAARELTEADLAVVVTDGQPTGSKRSRATCSPLGTEDVRALAGALNGFLDAGRGVWLVFERRAFQGTAFLNCSTPTQAIKEALAPKPRFSCGKECSYRHDGERLVLTLVVAAADAGESGERFVASYLAGLGDGAEALRLHASAVDGWSVRRPDIELTNGQGSEPVEVSGRGGEWQSVIRCPAGDVAARICLYAKARTPTRAISMGGLVAPTLQLEPRQPDDLYQLPEQTGFDPSALAELRPDESECSAVWARYRERAAELAPVASSCQAKPGEKTVEVVVACGCLRDGPREDPRDRPPPARLEWTQAHAPRERAAEQFGERYSAHAATWYQEPERINGLDALLEALAARPGEGGAAHIGRLELTLIPPTPN